MDHNKPWRVYIAESIRTKHFYVGISNDPDKRLMNHNAGRGSKFAVDQGPLKLVYLSPACGGKLEAMKREIQLKKWRREKKIWLIEGKIL